MVSFSFLLKLLNNSVLQCWREHHNRRLKQEENTKELGCTAAPCWSVHTQSLLCQKTLVHPFVNPGDPQRFTKQNGCWRGDPFFFFFLTLWGKRLVCKFFLLLFFFPLPSNFQVLQNKSQCFHVHSVFEHSLHKELVTNIQNL